MGMDRRQQFSIHKLGLRTTAIRKRLRLFTTQRRAMDGERMLSDESVFFGQKWDDAEAFCVEQGGHLASIHSERENTFVANLARTNKEQTNPHDLTWIGLQAKGSSWEWSDRSKVDYINWAPKQPDNPGKENCVEIAQDTSDHGWYENWNNENCDVVMRAFVSLQFIKKRTPKAAYKEIDDVWVSLRKDRTSDSGTTLSIRKKLMFTAIFPAHIDEDILVSSVPPYFLFYGTPAGTMYGIHLVMTFWLDRIVPNLLGILADACDPPPSGAAMPDARPKVEYFFLLFQELISMNVNRALFLDYKYPVTRFLKLVFLINSPSETTRIPGQQGSVLLTTATIPLLTCVPKSVADGLIRRKPSEFLEAVLVSHPNPCRPTNGFLPRLLLVVVIVDAFRMICFDDLIEPPRKKNMLNFSI
ncbi:hypothetical protein RB195_003993 [Necator americanus]|uniref:C-type lectin domain-containing protein n=1 Tax=Necator americanus TaxID=51031 RepID=A0ABR1DRM8_NECAM